MKRSVVVLACAALAASVVAPAGADRAQVDKTDNVKPIAQFKHEGGTELAGIGQLLVSGQADGGASGRRGAERNNGGMHIYDLSGSKPKEVGFLHCPGNDNDVEVIRPGLAAIGFHTNRCAPSAGEGLALVDIRKPSKPRIISALPTGRNHTFKPVPGTNLVYTAGGGLSGGTGRGPAIVDVSNPAKPKVVAQPKTITMDCHDISFWMGKDRDLGFCAGAIGTGEVQIWDVTDPLKPQTIGRIYNPAIQYSHYAVASSDGKLLAIDDEAFALHECNTGQSPTGRVWIYDISVPEVPLLQSSFAPPRGGDGGAGIGTYPGWIASWCLSHGLDWQPGTRNLGVTWFTGGWSVLDLRTPTMPKEVAYFHAEDSAAYSVLWHDGKLFTNDTRRGVDAFQIKGLPK